MARLLNLFRWRRDRLERDLDRELRYHMDRRVEDLIKRRTERARGPTTGEPRARRRAAGAGSRARHVDLAMARCARAGRALCGPEPDPELGFRPWRRRGACLGHRRKHRDLLDGQHGVAATARIPRRGTTSSRSKRSGRTLDEPVRRCRGPTFSTGRRRTMSSSRWRCPSADATSAIVVGDRAEFGNDRYVSRISLRCSARCRRRGAC